MSNQDLCTSRKAAELLGVTPRTVQLWADSGILQSWKTPGGHRRFSQSAIEALAADIRSGSLRPGELKNRDNVSSGERMRSSDSVLGLTQSSEGVGQQAGVDDTRVRVQVIEDEASLQRLYAMTFRNWGLPIELKQATDGYQGLLELGQFDPELLVLDINLPNIDGFNIVKALEQQGMLDQMHLIVVTALNRDQVQRRLDGFSSGIEVLPKPIPFQRIRERIEEILVGREVFS
ncbi:response regulator [Marinobacterium sediminicola]|uniref:DNA binding domain-containing protein, excisionase family n=1 Tax=Marinobacterium sediminicola TaxID=518898 RepID=A0ABY1S3H4_9GAMM|nr:response regulator [Marinobacterium sediminicola]ULG68180.1 response regulator [Marinobacterium sediminicola]SMR77706.1 DNA binding domain-containing protein, excisionase family [Marinobacterium sediminicola]